MLRNSVLTFSLSLLRPAARLSISACRWRLPSEAVRVAAE